MSDQASAQQDTQRADRRVSISMTGIFGVLATAAYLLFVFFVLLEGSFRSLLDLELNEIGDFLAGSLGPLGLFWLILGFFQQGAELRNSIKALDLQTNELKQSVEAQKVLAASTREQLELQQEEFALTAQELTKSREPKFVVSYLGVDDEIYSPYNDNNDREWCHRLAFANVGGTACEVEIYLGYGELMEETTKAAKFPEVIWPQFVTKSFYVPLLASDTHSAEISLEIRYRDAEGRQYLNGYLFSRVSEEGRLPKYEIQKPYRTDF